MRLATRYALLLGSMFAVGFNTYVAVEVGTPFAWAAFAATVVGVAYALAVIIKY